MKPIVTFFVLLLIGFTMSVKAQITPVSTLGTVSTPEGTAVVPITVANFSNIGASNLKIAYNPAVAIPTAVTIAPGVAGTPSLSWSIDASNLSAPILIIGWFSFAEVSLSNGSTILNITFNKVANGTTPLTFIDDENPSVNCQYTAFGGTSALLDWPTANYYHNGSLNFYSHVTTTAPTLTACPGTNISIPITVTGFASVGAVNMVMNYNSSVLTFVSAANTGGLGLSINGGTAGKVIVTGNVPGPDPVVYTISGSVIVTFTFTYNGGSTDLTWSTVPGECQYGGAFPTFTALPGTFVPGSITGPSSTQRIWTGNGTNAFWTTSANWCPQSLPDYTIDAIIPTNPAGNKMPIINPLLVGAGPPYYGPICKDLILSPGSTVTINSTYLPSNSTTYSGSLRVVGNASGTGKIIYNRLFNVELDFNTGDNIYDWHYFSSPVGNVTEITQSKISNIFPWEETKGDWGDPLSDKTQLQSGRGYNLDQEGASDGMISFTGSIVSSASVTATSPYNTNYSTGSYEEYLARVARTPFGGGGWNLLGNPFTSAMRISSFLDANDGDGSTATNNFDPNYVAIYIYDGSVSPNGQYLYRGMTSPFTDPVEGDTNPANAEFVNELIQTGQGFFVLAQKNGVVFTFDKTMQDFANVVPLKSAVAESPWPGLKLKAKGANNESSTVVMYNDQMTTGLDPGYDIGQLSTYPDVEIYTALVSKDNSVNFAQQALPVGEAAKSVVPVGVDAEKGGLVTFSASVRPIGNGTFYLEDKVTGTITDLSKDTYTVNLPEKTAGTGRFFIHTTMATGIQPILNQDDLSVRIWTANHRVNIEGAVSNKATGAIYDLLGRQLLQTRLDDTQFNTITVPESLKGVYLVKVTDGARISTAKVVF